MSEKWPLPYTDVSGFIHEINTESGRTFLDIREIAAVTEVDTGLGKYGDKLRRISIHLKSGTIFTTSSTNLKYDLTSLITITTWMRSGLAKDAVIAEHTVLRSE
tara:strand:- start:27290 stop:27601 length:312 start_codon:yes stop_codon:yes gene_type:complete